MSVGNTIPFNGYEAILGIGKETTFGTFITATAFLEFNSESLKYTKEEIKLESINGMRDYTRRMFGNTTVDGSIEAPLNLASDACVFLLKAGMGGTATAAAGSGTSKIHTLSQGTMDDDSTMRSLSLSVRPGNGSASTWSFYGCRVNQLTLKSEVGTPVIMNVDILGKGCSISATMPAASYSIINPLTFQNVAMSVGTTIGAATTTSQEYVKSFELTLNNNLYGDHRCLGSAEVVGIPAGKRDITLKVTQAFDTTTAFERYTTATLTAIKLTMDSGIAYGTSIGTYKMEVFLPRCYLNPFTPAVGGNDPVFQELEYRCMYSTEATYAIKMTVQNLTASY
jgi:hypothetical protein